MQIARGVGTLIPMSRHTGGCFVSGVNVMSVEETEEMCQGTSVRVVCILYGVVYGGTYMWLEWCFHFLTLYLYVTHTTRMPQLKIT